jgi:hypothetical protein
MVKLWLTPKDNHGQLGISLAFPPPYFSEQSYGLYVADVRGGEFTQYQAMWYVSKHTNTGSLNGLNTWSSTIY